MKRAELRQAITYTLQSIQNVKEELEKTFDPQKERRLQKQLKELQYLQLWNLEQYERASEQGDDS